MRSPLSHTVIATAVLIASPLTIASTHSVELGGALIRTDGIGGTGDCDYVGVLVLAEATIEAGRRTTAPFGLGLVDPLAVPRTL